MNANDLLFLLSARRQGSWQQFRAAVEELHFASQSEPEPETADEQEGGGLPLYRRLQFNLQRLAHVEFFTAECENGWRVAPPVLAVTRYEGGWAGMLCGARLPELLDRVSGACEACVVERNTQQAAPDLIRIQADCAERVAKLARILGARVQVEPSRAILTALPAVDDPGLLRLQELPAGAGWTVYRFSVSQLAWVLSSRDAARTAALGLYRFTYRYQREYVLCRRGIAYGVPVQIGKFLLLKARRRRRGVLRYDGQSESLLFNVVCHPPPLMDRALSLCSGQLPRYAAHAGTLSYGGVSREMAVHAAHLLRQEIG